MCSSSFCRLSPYGTGSVQHFLPWYSYLAVELLLCLLRTGLVEASCSGWDRVPLLISLTPAASDKPIFPVVHRGIFLKHSLAVLLHALPWDEVGFCPIALAYSTHPSHVSASCSRSYNTTLLVVPGIHHTLLLLTPVPLQILFLPPRFLSLQCLPSTPTHPLSLHSQTSSCPRHSVTAPPLQIGLISVLCVPLLFLLPPPHIVALHSLLWIEMASFVLLILESVCS